MVNPGQNKAKEGTGWVLQQMRGQDEWYNKKRGEQDDWHNKKRGGEQNDWHGKGGKKMTKNVALFCQKISRPLDSFQQY